MPSWYFQGSGHTSRRCNETPIYLYKLRMNTYDHRVWRTGLPVRSAVLKPHAGRLVVGWVTTSESLLLYVFDIFFGPTISGKVFPALKCLVAGNHTNDICP